jgi:hypothetical protein
VEQGIEAVQIFAVGSIEPHTLPGKTADKEVGDSAEVSVGVVVGQRGSQMAVQG